MLILADIMFRNNSFDSAIVHYKEMLTRVPGNYDALCQVLDMLKKNGSLDEAKVFFSLVEGNDICKQHAGYHYCKGLLHWFNNNPNAALDEFNKCRRDAKWGERAVYNMIEIFLNPENETIGGEALDASKSKSAEEKTDNELLALLTADKLLKDLVKTKPSVKANIMSAYVIMATKRKVDIERAIATLVEILNDDQDNVPALLVFLPDLILSRLQP
jgi:tetratricopeptide repeat protein 21B